MELILVQESSSSSAVLIRNCGKHKIILKDFQSWVNSSLWVSENISFVSNCSLLQYLMCFIWCFLTDSNIHKFSHISSTCRFCSRESNQIESKYLLYWELAFELIFPKCRKNSTLYITCQKLRRCWLCKRSKKN